MKIKIECSTADEHLAAGEFITWLCESGEQQYWDWMEIQESRSQGTFTILQFDYSRDLEIGCQEIGRLDEEGNKWDGT